jgi:hypothetical protein
MVEMLHWTDGPLLIFGVEIELVEDLVINSWEVAEGECFQGEKDMDICVLILL